MPGTTIVETEKQSWLGTNCGEWPSNKALAEVESKLFSQMVELLDFSPTALSLAWELERVNYYMVIYFTKNSFFKGICYKFLLNNKYFSVFFFVQ